MNTMTVTELKERMDQNDKPFLLDIREPMEREICKLEDDLHIPMQKLPQHLSDLDPTKEIVVYCRSGSRSAHVTSFLLNNGFSNVKNLIGGVLAWSDEIDPDMPKY